MANSYTSLWSAERCELLRKSGQVEAPLTILFGGPHQSEPRFRRFGVREGDYIYPVRVSAGILYILGRMKVGRLLTIEQYIAENPHMFAGLESSFGGQATFGNWQRAHPESLCFAPTCTDEVALGAEGTPIGLDVPVPPDVLASLRFCSQRGERGVKHVVEGRLKSLVSLQGGTYRLSEESARQFAALVDSAVQPPSVEVSHDRDNP